MRNSIVKPLSLIFLFTSLLAQVVFANSEPSSTGPVKVEIVNNNGSYQLLRGGKPYQVKGAGIEYGDIDALARHGGNSFRTWTTDSGGFTGQQLLDKAHSLGLTVSMNLPIMAERWGFDYDDEEFVNAQFEKAKQEVIKYKDHPALLSWIIGNELNYNYKNPKVYDAVNDISKMIHELDPNHPTTTTLAGYSKEIVALLNERAPDLDFISFQLYGDLINLPRYLKRDKFSQPYFVTEWGAIGHWEVGKTSWGAPIEQNSSEKAANYMKSYNTVIKPYPDQALGSYVFLWGQKQERTGTWYGMFTETGEATEVVDVMHNIWNGSWPENRTPALRKIYLNGRQAYNNVVLTANKTYKAKVAAKDPEKDPLTYQWEIRPESKATQEGGDKEAIPGVIKGLIKDDKQQKIQLTAPQTPGPYRLFVYVYDGNGHAAHANIPFYVK